MMRTVCACAAAITASLLLPGLAAAQTTTEHTVSVLGRGQIELQPDRGSFSLSVTRLDAKVNRARSRTNARIASIVRGLRGVGVERDDLTTSGVSISREKRRLTKDGPVVTRFRATVSMRVAVDGLERLGRAFDAASSNGATEVYGPSLSFSPERRSEGDLKSAEAALQDARTRAEAAAATEGQEIVGVQSIDLDPGQGQYAPLAFAQGAAADSGARRSVPTKILSAKRKVTAQARVTYIIEPVA